MTRSETLRSAVSFQRSHAHCIVLVFAALVVATSVRFALSDVAPNLTFVTYFPAVLICSVLTGWRYGSACAVLSGGTALLLLPGLGRSSFPDAGSWTGLFLFLISSAIIIAIIDALRRALLDLNDANQAAKTLNHELQHRVANTLAVVQALASQSAKGASREEFVESFNGRLQALAKAHELLGRRELATCTLPALVDEACQPFSTGTNIVKSGPVCQLPPESCVPLVLALHELCTNAVKYGALSTSSGRVEIIWTFDEASQRSTIMWHEVDGPPVSNPTRKGLGSALLRSQAGIAAVEHVFDRAGVTCKVIIDGAHSEGTTRPSIVPQPAPHPKLVTS